MKKQKIIMAIVMIMASLLLLTGCTKTKSYTYNVETGDTIKVEMKTNDGYDLTSKLPITFSKDGKEISQGGFAKAEAYEMYYNSFKEQTDVKILKENSNKNIEYFFYEFNDIDDNQIEYNYVIKIKNSNTCFLLANIISKESAQDIFERLTFTVEK